MSKKILIIDDNGYNGHMLGSVSLNRGWEVFWLRVTTGNPEPADDLHPDITCRVTSTQIEAAALIKEQAADDLIVFYDLQLTGVQEPTDAMSSLITKTLRDLMDDRERRALVNVHSAASQQDSKLIAEMLDPSLERVLFNDKVTRNLDKVLTVVENTLAKWNSLYVRQTLDAEGFITAMERMTHEQIQDYPNFIKTRIGKERLTDVEVRQRYPDPAYVLISYLGMDDVEFDNNFCDAPKALKGEVIEALKTISGLYSLENQEMGRRQLSWSGGWLLALGVFRTLKSKNNWQDIFNVEDLRGGQDDGAQQKWPNMHAMQKPPRRGKTVRLFVRMIKVLFTKKGTTTHESVLEKVELRANKDKAINLSFKLSFPCVGSVANESESLLGRIVEHVDLALAVAEGRAVEISDDERDTSRAIWKFFLSASICDLKDGVEDPDFGMAGGFTPMNIMSTEQNTKTEVLWLN